MRPLNLDMLTLVLSKELEQGSKMSGINTYVLQTALDCEKANRAITSWA